MNSQQKTREWSDLSFTSHDGLRLVGRHYKAVRGKGARRTSPKKPPNPLLCLSSLTGNSGEFHELACFLNTHNKHPRDVYCIDYRGRGQSQNDYTSANYNSYVELRDILDFLVSFDLPHFDIIGSSRGGINAMLLASVRPSGLGSLILNDLGPVLEPGGVARVLGYLANMPQPASWADAIQIMRSMYETSFTALDEGDWKAFAQRYYKEQDGHLVASYDTRLRLTSRHLNLQKTLPDMWRQYLALLNHPLLIIRGENSDMLSRKTVEQMRTLHWHSRAVTVPGQGHAPLLRDQPSLQTIGAFLAEHD
ncbi:MAG: alpha/beta hydrolase [bacterium]|nr:alpha/beta hydrolase [bacterium]